MGRHDAGHCDRCHRRGGAAGHDSRTQENGRQARHCFQRKAIGTTLLGVCGAIVLGVGMCMTMVWNMMIPGIVVGIVGIVALLSLIPVIKGLK